MESRGAKPFGIDRIRFKEVLNAVRCWIAIPRTSPEWRRGLSDFRNRVGTGYRLPQYQPQSKTDRQPELYHLGKVRFLNDGLPNLPRMSLSSRNSGKSLGSSPENKNYLHCTNNSGILLWSLRGERLAGVPVYGN